MARALPLRNDVEKKYTWNAERLFASPKAWESELELILEAIPSVKALKGTLGESASSLAQGLAAAEDLTARVYRALVYAGFAHSVDTTDQKAAAMNDRAQGALGGVSAAVSYVEPELIGIGAERLRQWAQSEPRLSHYGHYFDNLFRKQAHVRSAEVEELLGMLADPFSGPYAISSMLTNADFRFPSAESARGARIPISQGTLHAVLESKDRDTRRSAWDGYMAVYAGFKNTLAASLSASIKQNVLKTRARRFGSTLEAALFPENIPTEVFHNAIDVFRRRLPVWHRYFDVRRRALGLRTLGHYDMWAPLAKSRISFTYEKAVELICEGLAPMGREYVAAVRSGCLKERWVDVFPNKGKREGAFSEGCFGTLPYIMTSFTGNVSSVGTLAHELGHSMHSLLTWKSQPFVYSAYSLFVAEVASNLHQALVRASLLRGAAKAQMKIAVIEEAMANFFRYLFLMPTLARFELETHQRVERGQALTAESMSAIMTELLEEAYGKGVEVRQEREGMLWASFSHLFVDYYTFQYETGIGGAHAIAKGILAGQNGAVENYLRFLSAGSSVYPIDALKIAGVDLSRPQPVEEAFDVMSGYVDQLEELAP
jgi:oligoendopeptidase F